MTRDDIIRLALEAGLITTYGGRETASDELLERFATFVAAAEREACAKVCEDATSRIWEIHEECVKEACKNVCTNLATAIRARGQKS